MRRSQTPPLLAALLTAGSFAASCSPRSLGNDFDSGPGVLDARAPGDQVAADVPVVDAPVVDVGTVDVGTVDVGMVDAGRVCTPPLAECVSATVGRTCDASGTAWTEFLCSTSTTCSGGICRPATPTCSPGAATCTSASTLSVCGADGRTTTTTACAGAANATGRCTGSSCGIACNTGYGDCNATPADGCEASLATTANCGACGVRCGTGQTCSAGACVAGSCIAAGAQCMGSGCCAGLTCSSTSVGFCETTCPSSACRFTAGCGAGSTCRCPPAGCGCPTCVASTCDGAGNPRTNGTCCAGLSYRATPTVPLCCLEVNSACSTEALSSAECCGSMECRAGRCACQANGQRCSDNLDCCSRSCGAAGVCL